MSESINERTRKIFAKKNIIVTGWEEESRDGEIYVDCSADIKIEEGTRLGITAAAANLLAMLVSSMEPGDLDKEVEILAEINSMAAGKAAKIRNGGQG